MSIEIVICSLAIAIPIVFCAKIIVLAINTPTKWKDNDEKKAIEMLVEDISKAKKRIFIYGGTGETYENIAILKALGEKATPIKMIFENKDIGTTKLSELARSKPNIFLGFVEENIYKGHFRVIDHHYVYIERPHPKKSEKRSFKRFKQARFLPAKYAQRFSEIKSVATPII